MRSALGGVPVGPRARPTPMRAAGRWCDDDFVLLFNAHHEAMTFRLPATLGVARLARCWSTPRPRIRRRADRASLRRPARRYALPGARSLALLRSCEARRMKRRHDMPFGARLDAGGGATLPAVGAGGEARRPRAQRRARTRAASPMQAQADGWFEADVAHGAAPARATRFASTAICVVPDPASRFNPDDVHAPSALIDPRGVRLDATHDWRGRPWHEAVVYELHVGTFTRRRHVRRAVERLDDLVALGITAIELMPVADFPGRRNWGYDGVLPFAPDAELRHAGRAEAPRRRGARARADGAARRRLQPLRTRRQLSACVRAARSSTRSTQTPWGAAINFDGAGSRTVRDFFIHNALYWLEEFHFDGLRLDAVHAMPTTSPLHFVDELAIAVRAGPGRDRHVHLVLENDHNEARRLARDAGRRHAAVDGAVERRPAPRGARAGHRRTRRLLRRLRRASAVAVRPRARRGLRLPGRAVAVSRRRAARRAERASAAARVRRLPANARPGRQPRARRAPLRRRRLRSRCARWSPACCWRRATPMLFMGEEYAAQHAVPLLLRFPRRAGRGRHPWPARRVRALRALRRSRAARAHSRSERRTDLRRIEAEAGTSATRGEHAEWLALYRRLLQLRSERIVPLLPSLRSGSFELPAPGCVHVQWPAERGRRLHLRGEPVAVGRGRPVAARRRDLRQRCRQRRDALALRAVGACAVTLRAAMR